MSAPLQARVNNLLDPKTGILRGLTKGDAGNKPLGITIGEAREVSSVVASLAAVAFGNRQAVAADAGRPTLAQAYVDGIGSQLLEMQEDCIGLRILLDSAAKQFRFYEKEHRTKAEGFRHSATGRFADDVMKRENLLEDAASSDAKADTNAKFAQRLEDAIGTNPHVEVDQLLRRVIDVTHAGNSTGQLPRQMQDAILRKAMQK